MKTHFILYHDKRRNIRVQVKRGGKIVFHPYNRVRSCVNSLNNFIASIKTGDYVIENQIGFKP